MEIKFKRLTMQNFKGVLGERTIEFNATLTQILGANHTGKTTTADAVHYVLFGKNSEGATVFGITPKDTDGKIIPNLVTSVKLELTKDGHDITLERVRKEVRTKPRQGETETVSYPSTYFIDGNKVTQTDYKKEIDAMVTESLFKSITNPAYFPSLKAEDQRILLTRMVGETTPEAVIAQAPEAEQEGLRKVLEQIAGTDIQRFKEQRRYRINEVKKVLETIPTKIEENQNELAPLKEQHTDFDKVQDDILEAEQQMEKLDAQLADSTKALDAEYDARTKERTEIQNLRTKAQRIEQETEDRNRAKQRQHDLEVRKAKEEVEDIESKIARNKRSIDDSQKELQRLELKIADFKKRWNETEAETFEWDANLETCKYCGQRLPQENIDNQRNKLEAEFNRRKGIKQDELDAEATGIKTAKTKANAEMATYRENIEKLEGKLTIAKETLAGAQALNPDTEDYHSNDEWLNLQKEIQERTNKLENAPTVNNAETETTRNQIRARKQEWSTKRDQLRDKLATKSTIAKKEQRIKELEEQERKLNQQLADLEGEYYHAEQLEQAQISDLEKRVNAMFDNVRFKMFEHLLNGSTKPTCECTMHGTPYQDLSTSEKINAGIEIINAICRHTNTWAPCFIDNAESVNDVTPTRSQQILLIVSRDRQLTIIS